MSAPDRSGATSTAAVSFPRFPATGPGSPVRGRSWWARAWMTAVETSALDPGQVRKGRAYARSGRLGPISVETGRVIAPVFDEEMYTCELRIEPLGDAAWDRLAGEITDRAGHLAALLAGDLPRDLVSAADAAGVRLLPGIGDVEPECDCELWEHPCRHAAALAYQVSWVLDADPFLILLLRGRGTAELLADLARRRDRRTGSDGSPDRPGRADTDPAEIFGRPARPLPAPPPARRTPMPPPWSEDVVPGLPIRGWADALPRAAAGLREPGH